ncbi:MAG TPA: DUF167 domain-containing protein [bacterium]|nr:DUF167 domain-containing protein [bacterium]
MRATVTVIPRARAARVERLEDGTLRVAVTAPPHEGRANAAVVAALAEHFGVPQSQVRIVAGRSGRRKVVEVGGV